MTAQAPSLIILKCCICNTHIFSAQGEVIGSPEVRALCDTCQQDKIIIISYSKEAQDLNSKFLEAITPTNAKD